VIAPDDRSATDAEILSVLAAGEVEILGLLPGSTNFTYLARVRDGNDELLAVYKPREGEAPLWDFPDGTLYRREVAAYELATVLGWPRVPPTLHRDGPEGVGSVQRFLPFDLAEHYFTMQDDARWTNTFRRVALFDAVTNNADRKAGHCLLAEDGDLFFIDHGVCFNLEPKLRTVIWEFAGEPIPDDLRADVGRIAGDLRGGGPLCERLSPLLAPEEIEITARRAAAVARAERFPYPAGERPYPWPPV